MSPFGNQQPFAFTWSAECQGDTFEEAFESFHTKQRLFNGDVTFTYEGVPVMEDRTPINYAMSSGDVIVAIWDPGRSEGGRAGP